MNDWFDESMVKIFTTASFGAALGTLWRAFTRPETLAWNFIFKAFVAITVGTVIGGGIIQYFNLNGFIAAGVGAITAFLSEEVLKFIQFRGRKLEKGVIDTSINGQDDDE
jgi:hypothetical protein